MQFGPGRDDHGSFIELVNLPCNFLSLNGNQSCGIGVLNPYATPCEGSDRGDEIVCSAIAAVNMRQRLAVQGQANGSECHVRGPRAHSLREHCCQEREGTSGPPQAAIRFKTY